MLIMGGFCLLMLLCGLGVMSVRAGEGRDLVLPGADDVRIEGRGTAHLHIVYTLPPDQPLHDLNQYLLSRGWRRVTTRNFDRPGPVFARYNWFGIVREVVIVNPRPARPQTADISVARCFRIGSWISCP
jgi:hypothetical protein